MDDLIELATLPNPEESYLVAGWRQWADAGAVSSALPQYLIEHTGARRIGQIRSDPFYLFQLPGAQHLLRPEIKLQEGYRAELRSRKNEIFYSGDDRKGLFVFLGDEPHLNPDRYAGVFFDLVKSLKVKRVATVGGVYAPVPYDKDRPISCTYSLPQMKSELARYAVRFSNYEGGASIGSFLVDQAEQQGIEYLVFHAMVPMYDFSELSPEVEGIMIERDYKAWNDVMRRLNYMFKLGLDLAELEKQSQEVIQSISEQLDKLEDQVPKGKVQEYLEKVNANYTDASFMPLDDVWEIGLRDLFKDSEDQDPIA